MLFRSDTDVMNQPESPERFLVRRLVDDEVERVGAVLGLARLYQGNGFYLVAWENEEPLGHAYLALTDPPELQDVQVRPEQRRRGVASAMTSAAELRAKYFVGRAAELDLFGSALNHDPSESRGEHRRAVQPDRRPIRVTRHRRWAERPLKGAFRTRTENDLRQSAACTRGARPPPEGAAPPPLFRPAPPPVALPRVERGAEI